MKILGISAYYHDSAAVLIEDGQVVAGVEEERFSRIKHDNNFPFHAIDFCLKTVGGNINKIDYVAYYEKPLLKFERILETFLQTYPFSLRPFLKGLPEWLDYKIKIEHTIRKKLGYKGKIFFIPHHLSHASVAFYPSPYKKAAILTIDGVGEYQTTGMWMGEGTRIIPLKKIDFPHSLGLLYSTFTAFLGFKVNEDEYKLMGLAAYGKPTFIDSINRLIETKVDGSFQLDLSYFNFREGFRMWSKKFEELFGSPRKSSDPITKRDRDLAASIQKVTEEIYFKSLNYLHALAPSENLCLSGGVALNALANGKIYQKTRFKNVYAFGAAGDSGAALGAALFTYYTILGNMKRITIKNLYFGSSYSDEEVEMTLKKYKLKYKKYSEGELIKKVAKLLSQGKIIGWFQGKMEFGPRALGNRSILANPKDRKMKDKVNVIKRREQFRPFAGSVLQEHVHELFEVPGKIHWSPFMNFCFQVNQKTEDKIAAIVHEDKSCRIQTVSRENGVYYKLIVEFYKMTGIPCILNTSFNLRGEPIVENPEQAIGDFLRTKMDYLVIGDFLVSKN